MRTGKTKGNRVSQPPGKNSSKAPGLEIELKFEVPPQARKALLKDLAGKDCRHQHLVSRYFDTPDRRLAGGGMALRLRQVGEQWFQTLKAQKPGRRHERDEHEVEIPDVPAGVRPDPDPARHAGTPAGRCLRKILADDPGCSLVEFFATAVNRMAWEIHEAGLDVELAFDDGHVEAGGRRVPVCELELELKSGPPELLPGRARQWVTRYGLWLNTESKAARGERLLCGRPAMPVAKAKSPALPAPVDADSFLRAMVLNCLDQIQPNAAAVASDLAEHEHVHQLRVGLRRLRTLMRELGDFSDKLDPDWESPVADAFRQLGEYRDRNAVLEALGPELLAAGAPGIDWMKSAAGVADPGAIVRAPVFQGVLLDLLAFAIAPAGGPDKEGREVRSRLKKRVAKLHRRVLAQGARFDKLTEEERHTVRKRLKGLRYLGEFAGALFDSEAVSTYLRYLRPAQDTLGRHNDLAVAGAMAREAREQSIPDAAFALAWLKEQAKRSVKDCRLALKQLEDAPLFWKKRA